MSFLFNGMLRHWLAKHLNKAWMWIFKSFSVRCSLCSIFLLCDWETSLFLFVGFTFGKLCCKSYGLLCEEVCLCISISKPLAVSFGHVSLLSLPATILPQGPRLAPETNTTGDWPYWLYERTPGADPQTHPASTVAQGRFQGPSSGCPRLQDWISTGRRPQQIYEDLRELVDLLSAFHGSIVESTRCMLQETRDLHVEHLEVGSTVIQWLGMNQLGPGGCVGWNRLKVRDD